MHPLDNPAWTALTTHQAPLALGEGMARRFPPEMSMFGALALLLPPAWASLARLSPAPVGLLSPQPLLLPAGWSVTRHVELVQMVREDPGDGQSATTRPAKRELQILELTEADVADMSLLYEATRPGRKICPRIQKLGTFLGIRSEGKLVAMGGLRMHLPGYHEITTVATMPGHEGNGYATQLVGDLVRRIREHSERPFLTVRTDNARAIAIYERLGFRERRQLYSTTVTSSN
ncbi:MAG TPA: GNAT family N-acetyltransferase [Terriglobales bacterium]